MKRVNVFLSEKDIEILREHKKRIRLLAGYAPWKTVTISDLVRFAVSRTWNTPYESPHIEKAILRAYLATDDKIKPKEGEPAITI